MIVDTLLSVDISKCRFFIFYNLNLTSRFQFHNTLGSYTCVNINMKINEINLNQHLIINITTSPRVRCHAPSLTLLR